MQGERAPCPSCSGRGTVDAFINRGEDIATHSFELIACLRCGGSGRIPVEQLARIESGRHKRQERIARGESLSECAKRLGMTPAELSAIEMGRVADAR